jgi:hypothetical protein
MRRFTIVLAGTVGAIGIAAFAGCVIVRGDAQAVRGKTYDHRGSTHSGEELARLLVKLEKRTRAVVAGHYVRADEPHRAWMAENLLLPAAVADNVFHETVPKATTGRAWVKMVVDSPRNPHNSGDQTAVELLAELKGGAAWAQRYTPSACYYAEPIKTARTCLLCHGEPSGQPDPFFPQYTKNGWREGEVIGAIVARVEPAT